MILKAISFCIALTASASLTMSLLKTTTALLFLGGAAAQSLYCNNTADMTIWDATGKAGE